MYLNRSKYRSIKKEWEYIEETKWLILLRVHSDMSFIRQCDLEWIFMQRAMNRVIGCQTQVLSTLGELIINIFLIKSCRTGSFKLIHSLNYKIYKIYLFHF